MKGRGVLALLLFFLLLVPHQRIESNPVLITKTLVWGSKLIRVSIPFTLNRLKDLYTRWKSAGCPSFSKLKIPFSTAIAYIGVSWLVSEFERIAQLEGGYSSDTSFVVDTTGIGVQGVEDVKIRKGEKAEREKIENYGDNRNLGTVYTQSIPQEQESMSR